MRGVYDPCRLDLIFTRDRNDIKMKYQCPLGKIDYMVTEIEVLMESIREGRNTHKKDKYNYRKADFEGLRNLFGSCDWSELVTADYSSQI